jgi:Protein of unknown function (DUF1822)
MRSPTSTEHQQLIHQKLTRAMVDRSKSINRQIELMPHSLVLLVGMVAQPDGEVRVSVEVHPGSGEQIIPPQLYLVCTDKNDSVLGTVVAGNNDALIQLPPFTCSVGTEFRIGLQINCMITEEHFVV